MIEGNVVEEIEEILGVEFSTIEKEAIGTAIVHWGELMAVKNGHEEPRMTKSEALEVLKLYRDWNTAAKGLNAEEEQILAGRRALIEEAQRVLVARVDRQAEGLKAG